MIKNARIFVADFETTTFEGQTSTEVWASACVEIGTEMVFVFNSIEQQFNYFKNLKSNVIVYFHNLKFDGSFWLPFLIDDLHYTLAIRHTGEQREDVEWIDDKYMSSKTFKYSISERGAWYTIKIKTGKHFIEIRDSLKLLPFSVKVIGEAFKTKHQKTEIEYKGFRYAGCEITDKEKEYIANDVLVVKEALEIIFKQGHNSLTIGSCCMKEFKKIYRNHRKTKEDDWLADYEYKYLFPDLTQFLIDENLYGAKTADEYIRKSYRGGWCYVVKGKENKVFYHGITADVNSLYPSMMSSESGNEYPIKLPTFWKGDYIPDVAENKYYFIRFRTRFYLKKGMLPTIQIKQNPNYKSTLWLETSDIYNAKTGKYYKSYYDLDGNKQQAVCEMTMTKTDFILFKEHYRLEDFEILDGCYFETRIGLFDTYVDRYKKQKLENKGALRELAKLFLNNLYGKLASSTDSSYKVAYNKPDGTLGFFLVEEHNKKAGYIAIGSAITSYARNFTIRAAQKNYYGVNKRGFIYADTDSIHCDLNADEIKGIKVHDKNFCCWKLEATWDRGYFTRQKTYIEHVIEENLKPIEKPYYNIKCAGMADKCKRLFEISLEGTADIEGYIDRFGNHKEWTDDEKEFLFDAETGQPIKRDLTDFKKGLRIPDRLVSKRIRGGIVLRDDFYTMK
jgi:hypothetical protein